MDLDDYPFFTKFIASLTARGMDISDAYIKAKEIESQVIKELGAKYDFEELAWEIEDRMYHYLHNLH